MYWALLVVAIVVTWRESDQYWREHDLRRAQQANELLVRSTKQADELMARSTKQADELLVRLTKERHTPEEWIRFGGIVARYEPEMPNPLRQATACDESYPPACLTTARVDDRTSTRR
jgi:hypothetical protein